jgi:hypothetical protein
MMTLVLENEKMTNRGLNTAEKEKKKDSSQGRHTLHTRPSTRLLRKRGLA